MAVGCGFAGFPTISLGRLLGAGLVLLAASACTHVESVYTAPPESPPPPRQAPAKPAVAIVVSSNAPAYLSVARALSERLEREHLRYSLDSAPAPVLRELIDREGFHEVIAIGRAAAEAMQPFGPERVIYCQVFYDDALRDAGFRGVAAQPPFALQLDRWTRLEPGLHRVGVIAGPDSATLIANLAGATSAYGIELFHEEVTNDKQALFVFQRMVPEIDGYLFLPDTSVLSPGVIRKMMRYGNKHKISILVYSPVMFELGRAVLIRPEPDDVARQIATLLDHPAPPAERRRELTRVAVTVADQRQLALLESLGRDAMP